MTETAVIVDHDNQRRGVRVFEDGSILTRAVPGIVAGLKIGTVGIPDNGLPVLVSNGAGFVDILQVPTGFVATVKFHLSRLSGSGMALATARITDGVTNRDINVETGAGVVPWVFSITIGPGISIKVQKNNAGDLLAWADIVLGTL